MTGRASQRLSLESFVDVHFLSRDCPISGETRPQKYYECKPCKGRKCQLGGVGGDQIKLTG